MELETYRGAIYPWHCDFNNHMNVQYYVSKYDEATWQFMSYFGISPSYLRENHRGMVAAEQNFKYYREVFSGDLIHIKTKLLEFKQKTIIFVHKMYNSESNLLLAEGKMVAIHLNTKSRKSIEIPHEIYQKGLGFLTLNAD